MLCDHCVLWYWLCFGYASDTQLFATGMSTVLMVLYETSLASSFQEEYMLL